MAKEFIPLRAYTPYSAFYRNGASVEHAYGRWWFTGAPRDLQHVGSESGEMFRFTIVGGGMPVQIGECNHNYLGNNDEYGYSELVKIIEWNEVDFKIISSSHFKDDFSVGGYICWGSYDSNTMLSHYSGGGESGYGFGEQYAKFPSAIAGFGSLSHGYIRWGGCSAVKRTVKTWSYNGGSNTAYNDVTLPSDIGDIGNSMYIMGDWMFIGGADNGTVLQYKLVTGQWERQADLTATNSGDLTFGYGFGHFTDDDNTLYISGENTYIYKFIWSGSAWVEDSFIDATGYANIAGSDYGLRINCYEDLIFVSAKRHGYDEADANYLVNSGAVYVYNRSDMSFLKKLVTPSDLNDGGHNVSRRWSNQYFGGDVAYNGDYLCVGSDRSGYTNGDDSGRVWVFKYVDLATIHQTKSNVSIR